MFKQLAILSVILAGFGISQVEANISPSQIDGTYFRTDVIDAVNQSSDVFQLDATGKATYLQGGFLVSNASEGKKAMELDQIAHGFWFKDDSDKSGNSIFVMTVSYNIPNANSEQVGATRYTHRIVFSGSGTLNNPAITDRQFVSFSSLDLSSPNSTAELLDPSKGTTVIAGSHLATPRVLTRVSTSNNTAFSSDLLRSP